MTLTLWALENVTLMPHYSDVIMGMVASQITNLTIVYSTVYSDADQRKHESSASLASWNVYFSKSVLKWISGAISVKLCRGARKSINDKSLASSNGLVPSRNKTFPEPMLTLFHSFARGTTVCLLCLLGLNYDERSGRRQIKLHKHALSLLLRCTGGNIPVWDTLQICNIYQQLSCLNPWVWYTLLPFQESQNHINPNQRMILLLHTIEMPQSLNQWFQNSTRTCMTMNIAILIVL